MDLKVYTPACLPAFGDTFVGQKAWVYGNTIIFSCKIDEKYSKFVCLDLENKPHTFLSLSIDLFEFSGWGTTSFGGSVSDKLLEVRVPVVSNTVCSQVMQNTVMFIIFYNLYL